MVIRFHVAAGCFSSGCMICGLILRFVELIYLVMFWDRARDSRKLCF